MANENNGEPYFRVPKEAFDRIDQGLEREDAATAKLVYVALCLLANRAESISFEKPIQYVAVVASLGRRTVERRLKDLVYLKLVSVKRQKLPGTKGNLPSRYTLTSLRQEGVTSLRRNLASRMKPVADASSRHKVAVPKEDIKEEGKTSDKITPSGSSLRQEVARKAIEL